MAHRFIPGGRVVLCDGTYNFSGRAQLTRQKTNVQGMGGATHIKPTSFGFSELFHVFHHHCRVGMMLMCDDADDHKDLTAVVRMDNGPSWGIIEHVHSHGLGFDLAGMTGATLINPEVHRSTATQKNTSAPAIRLAATVQRVIGGFVRGAQAQGLLLVGAQKATVRGLTVEGASESTLNAFNAVDVTTSTAYATVDTNSEAGMAASALRETASCSNNTFYGKYNGATTVQAGSAIYA